MITDPQETSEYLQVKLADGSYAKILIGNGRSEVVKTKGPDKVKDYAHNALEACLLFKYFLEIVARPDRGRLLALLKVMMLILKGHSKNAKYPREILRILVQQYSVMGLREACTVLQACFVNLRGKDGTHVPADLIQEWNVRESKAHIKHMFANKTDATISKKTAALPCIHKVTENFDNEIGTLVRAKRHKKKDSYEDEMKMINDFRIVRPLCHKEGRYYKGFKNIPRSSSTRVDGFSLRSWFEQNKGSFFM